MSCPANGRTNGLEEVDMKIDIIKAKASWDAAGLSAQGRKLVNEWIDRLAANIEAKPGKWDAYAGDAYCVGKDYRGRLQLLKSAAELTSK
jgi:hypothetical protein